MSDEPIYKQVMRDLEDRAFGGKEQYGEHLTADTKIDGLQYLYEELLDGANYIRKAMDDRRALLEYVARLEAALRPFGTSGVVECLDRMDFSIMQERIVDWFGPSDFKNAAATLATSPLTGQPLQKVQQLSPWRPIAEAEDGVKLDVVGQHTKAVRCGWLRGLGYYKAEAVRDGFTYFFMYPDPPAPPKEGE